MKVWFKWYRFLAEYKKCIRTITLFNRCCVGMFKLKKDKIGTEMEFHDKSLTV